MFCSRPGHYIPAVHFLIRHFDVENRQRLFWRIQAIGWGATALVSLGFVTHLSLKDAALIGIFRAVFGFVVTSFVLRPMLRSIRQKQKGASWAYLIPVFVLCGFLGWADARTMTFLATATGLDFGRPELREFLAVSFPIRWSLYLIWCVLYFGLLYWMETQHERLRIAERQTALQAAELQVLRAQVNPHFLFNALNSLLAESSHPAEVQRITLALATYLRFSLRHQQNTDLLGVELDALESYLSVEKMRFEENLEYTIESDDASRQAAAPVALIQPLLENAIKYGQRSTIRPLKVRIVTRVENRELIVRVINSGEWAQPNSGSSTGIGLSNLRRRLDLLYPGRASVTVGVAEHEVNVCVKLSLEGAAP